MITALALAAILSTPVQDKIDFQLGWKKGDKFDYSVGMKSPGGKAEGRLKLTVATVDEKIMKVTWPEITYSSGMSPHAAGSQTMNNRGRLTGKEKMADAAMYLVQMSLPDKPVAIGDDFKVAYAFGDSKVDLTGTFVRIDETKGKVAHFTLAGSMATPDGGTIKIKLESTFDIVRGIFLSSEMVMTDFGMQFFLTLVESDS